MTSNLSGRTALVTGAAGSLGGAVCRALTAAQARVFLVDVNEAALQQSVAALRRGGAEVACCVADATSAADVQRAMDQCAGWSEGALDILVNVAGGAGSRTVRHIEEIDEQDWDAVLALNLKGTFLFSRAAVPLMRARGFGRIVNFSSTLAYGKKGPITTTGCRLAYATSKAALFGFTAQLAKDVAMHGITVNALVLPLVLGAPGTRSRDRYDAMPATEREAWMADFPMGRPAYAEEVAAMVLFLAGEGSAYISGAALPVDGAFT